MRSEEERREVVSKWALEYCRLDGMSSKTSLALESLRGILEWHTDCLERLEERDGPNSTAVEPEDTGESPESFRARATSDIVRAMMNMVKVVGENWNPELRRVLELLVTAHGHLVSSEPKQP